MKLLLAALLLVTISGCSSREDAAFRGSVVPVLQHAAELDKAIEDSYMLGAEAPDSVVAAFHREVVGIPPARNRKLRYLAMRLQVLSDAAAARVRGQGFFAFARSVYSETTERAGGSAEAEETSKVAFNDAVRARTLYVEDYQIAAEAERMALGTNTLWDRLSSLLMGAPSDSGRGAYSRAQMDSIRTVRERFVRRELGSFP